MILAKDYDVHDSQITCLYDKKDIPFLPRYGEILDIYDLEITIGDVMYDKNYIIIYEVIKVALSETLRE
jgi:hypothetical protein